jgi:TRAP-type C4-dicarboxylate transport system permease small subunit
LDPVHQNNNARENRGHYANTLIRLWSFITEGLAVLGTVMIGVLMVIICADIVFRNLFGSSLPLVSELGALLLVMIVYLQLAATIRADRLARTEIFTTPLKRRSPRLALWLEAVFDLVGGAMIGLIAWSTIDILEKDIAAGQFIGVQGIATLQTWPFRALILLGVTAAAIEFLGRAIGNISMANNKVNSP